MSGETEQNISGWTVDTLKAHLHSLIDERDRQYGQRFEAQQIAMSAALAAQEKAVNAALAAAERAVQKAEVAAEKRFDAVNEFRAQLADQAATLMPRAETEQRLSALTEKVDGLGSRLERTEGRTGGLNAGWGYLIGAIGALAAVVTIVLVLARP